MIHYHGSPITPRSVLYELHGRNFCVSFANPRDVEVCHQIGQSVMLDNGAFSYWKRNKIQNTPRDWKAFYQWAEPWLDFKTTWAVIPDVIEGNEHDNGLLIAEWFREMGSYKQAAPVWHLHESWDFLERLTRNFDRVCFGSSGEYSLPNSPKWNDRINEAFNRICKGSGSPPCWIHMLRGMSLSGSIYPFASVDSADVARNHEGVNGRALEMVKAWDARQCPGRWIEQPLQMQLEHA